MNIKEYLKEKEVKCNNIEVEVFLEYMSNKSIMNLVRNIFYFEQRGYYISELEYVTTKKLCYLQGKDKQGNIYPMITLDTTTVVEQMVRNGIKI
ncbi:hypothetical protein [Methanosphaera sp.]|jgi:hypothetical protein|uniref:hypothetical protein n=1 Tax=Methanosphaera sp. TaxID=2666342 RepID=UPI003D8D6A6B